MGVISAPELKKMVKIVIILGYRLDYPAISPELQGRMNVGIKLFQDINADFLVLSGGRSNTAISVDECKVMKMYCVKKGIDPLRIIEECDSLDTIGNAFFTRKIIEKIQGITEIYCISSCYHMDRVKYIFSKCYGPRYFLNFSYCFTTPGDLEHEQNSMHQSRQFFKNIQDGDMEEIQKRLYSTHSLYMNGNKL